jgi:phage protein D
MTITQPIQTRLQILFTASDKDVTESLMPDLLSFTYEDKETNEADELSITLKDPTGKWAGSWKPKGGERIRASIISGSILTPKKVLNCGRFFVDTLSASGSPRVFEIRAVSVPLNTPIRKKIKSKAWEKTSLKSIAEAVAKENKVKLLYDAKESPSYDRQDQQRESDLRFLGRLCEEAGLSLKVTDEQVVIFDQAYYESKSPVKTFTLGTSSILAWDFEQAQSETYKSVKVTYRNPKAKKQGQAGGYKLDEHGGVTSEKKGKNPAVMEYIYTDPEADEEGQDYELKKRATSIAEAKRLAKAKLRQLNLRSVTGNLTIIGDTTMVAGIVIAIKGFGSFDGNFYVESASHEVSSSGYTTALALRRVNNKY